MRSPVRRLLPALCIAVAVLAAACSHAAADAASVNGVAISNDQLKEMVQAQLAAQSASSDNPQSQDIQGLTRQSLEGLIQFQIVLDGARKEGVSVPESDVDARLQELKSQASAQGTTYEDLLRSRNLTESLLREQYRVQLAVDLVAVKLVPYAPDATLLKALDKRKEEFLQVHVRHVLVKDKATADKARKQLVGSGDWSGVAKRLSIDSQTKGKAGDLGFISKGQTATAFEKAEQSLAAQGDCKGKTTGSCRSPVSQPVHTQFGYHVLQVIGVRLPTLDNNLRSQLDPTVKTRRQQAVQRWFDSLVKQADVTINPRYGAWDAGSGKVVERQNGSTATSSSSAPTSTSP
ncbi:MAG TPA: SurA N-terminal domain-containing protein [Actinomycetes bacterium]|nr:SurA N-terminal domain-containing protein [Actinomycetes bacterium]